MSKETLEWLNNNTLIGFTEKRGNAWHYRASVQGAEPNHYPGAIPVDDVVRRLFYWDAVKGRNTATWLYNGEIVTTEDTERFPVGRPETGRIFSYVAEDYEIHQYRDTLITNVANLLDDDLGIGSAGLLRDGGQAWVSVEVPDTITTPEGVQFRPNLLACTSHDKTLSTTYKRVVTNVVCDNTMSAGLAETGQLYKIRHKKGNRIKLKDARDALQVVHTIADDFAAEVAALCMVDVSDKAWSAFVQAHMPIESDASRATRTRIERERGRITQLWNSDNRVAPWHGTAWGVVQAVNTFEHHEATIRKSTVRAERNLSRALTDKASAMDQDTVRLLHGLLESV